MKWVKKGLIFKPDNNYDWMVSHASVPVVDQVDDNVLRIYFGTRDLLGRSHPGYLEVEADKPSNVLHVHDKPILPLGKLGTFDDNGIMPSWIVNHEVTKYLYYIGWNPMVTVSYRTSIGLAISKDGGKNYLKYSEGPICDRSIDEPYFNTTPCVLTNDNIWRMWYASCTGWKVVNERTEPLYQVKYAESKDGVHWTKTGKVCIDYDGFAETIGRPCVFIDGNVYRMIYSYRSARDYRTDQKQSYRFGYAESADGMNWTRNDSEVGIDRSVEGWDSEMIEYCYVYEHKNRKYMFYNGNGFGRSGLGYAVLEEG